MKRDRGRRGKRRSRSAPDDDDRWDDDDRFDDDDLDDDDDDRPRGRRSSRSRRGSRSDPPAPRRGSGRERGRGSERSGRTSRRGKGDDWDWGADDDEDSIDERRYDDEDSMDERPRRRRRAPRRPSGPRKSLSLMELCTPVFTFAAMLPRDPAASQPPYESFRNEVVTALQRIEKEGPENKIEIEDARQAVYALCFFLDEQVVESEWTAKTEWAGAPLGIMMQQDPEGGVHFFSRLDALGERQSAVREIFLVCLAMGYRGKYAELPLTEQVARIGEIRQKLARRIQPTPMEKIPELFPEGYRDADSIEDEVPPPPKWWVVASLGAIVLAVVLYAALYMLAGSAANEPDRNIKELMQQNSAITAIDRQEIPS